jgi:hypothetical protein
MARATLLFETKRLYDDGHIMEAKIWVVPAPVPGSGHNIKYSLYYGVPGQRHVGYDNETGKGDHRHYGRRQEPYGFTTVEQLVRDFLADVSALRGGEL